MTDLEQVTCSKCDKTYHREIEPDYIFFQNICADCKPKPKFVTYGYGAYHITSRELNT